MSDKKEAIELVEKHIDNRSESSALVDEIHRLSQTTMYSAAHASEALLRMVKVIGGEVDEQ